MTETEFEAIWAVASCEPASVTRPFSGQHYGSDAVYSFRTMEELHRWVNLAPIYPVEENPAMNQRCRRATD